MKMNFDYTVKTSKDFGAAVSAVEEETDKAGFRVLYVHDVQKTLSEKGFKIEPMKIIEACNAQSAFAALSADIKIGLCLPCKINVYVKDEGVFISGMRPVVLKEFFPEANLRDLPEEVDKTVTSIVDKSK